MISPLVDQLNAAEQEIHKLRQLLKTNLKDVDMIRSIEGMSSGEVLKLSYDLIIQSREKL